MRFKISCLRCCVFLKKDPKALIYFLNNLFNHSKVYIYQIKSCNSEWRRYHNIKLINLFIVCLQPQTNSQQPKVSISLVQQNVEKISISSQYVLSLFLSCTHTFSCIVVIKSSNSNPTLLLLPYIYIYIYIYIYKYKQAHTVKKMLLFGTISEIEEKTNSLSNNNPKQYIPHTTYKVVSFNS